MHQRRFPRLAGALLCAGLAWPTSVRSADDTPPNPQPGVEVQARGPVHEAYAEPAETRPEPGPVVPKKPPDPVPETAPDQKPEGDDVVWIPGYWSWDNEAADFTWVSGFWRTPPPNRVWTPGFWQQVDGGWQWVPGFWAPQDVPQIDYLPPPPTSIDNGPSVPAPDETSVYVPGCWVYHETRYLWRPGYWVAFNPDWCWIPDHYCWTPSGYIFVAGYWDYPLEGRGLLFAPVRFDRDLLTRADFSYVPEYAVEPDFLLTALFVRPAYEQYYFGDYFEDRYQHEGFTPWVDYRMGKYAFDPNFAYYRHLHHGEGRWESALRDLYTGRRNGDVPRPPRTWAQQTQLVNKITTNHTANAEISKNVNWTALQSVTALAPIGKANGIRLTGLAALAGARNAGEKTEKTMRLESVPRDRQAEVRQRVKQYRDLSAARQHEEARLLSGGDVPVKPTDRPRTVKLDRPATPSRPQEPGREPANHAPAPPPLPPAPRHEERPIPTHETATPSRPPQNPNPPGPKEPMTPPHEPATTPREPTPPPKEPPMPPKEPTPKELPPPKEPPTPPPHREPPTPPPPREPATVPAPKEPPRPPKEPPMPPKEPTPKELPPPKEPPTPPPHREPPAPPPPREPATVPAPKEPPPQPHQEPAPPHKDKDKEKPPAPAL